MYQTIEEYVEFYALYVRCQTDHIFKKTESIKNQLQQRTSDAMTKGVRMLYYFFIYGGYDG